MVRHLSSRKKFSTLMGVQLICSLIIVDYRFSGGLQKKSTYRGFQKIEVSYLWRCSIYGGVQLIEVFNLWRCSTYGGVLLMQVFYL